MKFVGQILLAIIVLVGIGTADAQTTQSPDGPLDFGSDGLSVPPVIIVNGHTARTAQLLGEAYRQKNPLVWKRAQYVADLGRVALANGTPFLVEAMTDAAPEVRAQAARSAGLIENAPESLLGEVEKLLGDPDARVRAQAVESAATLARAQHKTSRAIERSLSDADQSVVAAALRSAWTPEQAPAIAAKLPTLSKDLQIEAAEALGRLKAAPQAGAIVPLLAGDVPQRGAAVRALTAIGDRSQSDAVLKLLADPHPTVRREATAAVRALADVSTQQARAIQMLGDPDATVRQVAAVVLTPMPSTDAQAALLPRLADDYPPLHEALRQSLTHPADATLREASIQSAAKMLADADPRRREDASYVLGHLRSNAAIAQHINLLQWDPSDPKKADWPLIAQAAESLGLIGDVSAADPLILLIKDSPEFLSALQRPQRDAMTRASANALAAVARLRHRPAMAEAVRILKMNPDACPGSLRASAAFTIGVLSDNGKPPAGVNLLAIYGSMYESADAKFEALKALGNLAYAPAAEQLQAISESDPTPQLRWIAHWSYQRAAKRQVPYSPPVEKRELSVSISNLP